MKNLNHASKRPVATHTALGVGVAPVLWESDSPDPPPGAIVVFDTETYPFSQGNKAPPLVVLGWRGLEYGPINLLSRTAALAWLRRQLPRRDITWVAHNAGFDFGVVAQEIGIEPVHALYKAGGVRCTVVREKLRNVACSPFTVPADLAACIRMRWGWNLTGKKKEDGETADPWRKRYHELADMPLSSWPPEALQYAADDVAWTAALYQDQQRPLALKTVWNSRVQTVTYEGGGPDEPARTMAGWAAGVLGAWGLRTDPEAVDDANRACQAEIAEHRAFLIAEGTIRPNGVWNRKAIEAHVETEWGGLKVGPLPQTDKGATKTDKDTLKRLDTPLANLILTLRDAEKVGQFIQTAATGAKYPICASYNVLVASGRWSCRGPNLQQMPRKGPVRECFVPRPGYVYVWVDLDSMELRAWAQAVTDIFGEGSSALQRHYSRDPSFDPHSAFGAQLLGISYADFRARLKVGDKECADARQFAKIANFGYMGGMGAKSLVDYARTAYGKVITLDFSKHLREVWFRTWPEARRYLSWIGENVEYASAVNSCEFGGWTLPQIRTGRVRAGCSFTNAANTFFQGLAAEGGTAALAAVVDECFTLDSALFGSRPVWFIHDEIGMETPVNKADAAADRLIEIMVERVSAFTPNVPIRASATVSRRWSKKAESTRGEDGKWTINF